MQGLPARPILPFQRETAQILNEHWTTGSRDLSWLPQIAKNLEQPATTLPGTVDERKQIVKRAFYKARSARAAAVPAR